MVPVYTTQLSASDYGLFETFKAIVLLILPVISFGTTISFRRRYLNQDSETQKNAVSNAFTISVLVFSGVLAVSTMLVLIFRNSIVEILNLSIGLLFIAIGTAFLEASVSFASNLLQARREPWKYARLMNGKIFLESLMAFTLIYLFARGFSGRMVGYLVSVAVASSAVLVLLAREGVTWSRLRDFHGVTNMLVEGVPLTVSEIASWSITNLNKIYLTSLASTEQTAAYSIALRLASALLMFNAAIARAWMPHFYINRDINRRKIKKQIRFVIFMIVLSAGLLLISGPALLRFADQGGYGASTTMFNLLIVGYIFGGITGIYNHFLLKNGRTAIFAGTVIISGLVMVVASPGQIRSFGATGAAMVAVLSLFVRMCLVYVAARKIDPGFFEKT